MGRKSKSDEKRQIILDAFETVIRRDGYAKASQRKIAEEAGVNQPMIHHYFSGGDELLDALLDRITERYREALNHFTKATEEPSLEDVLTFLCSEEFHSVSEQNQVMFFLVGQVQHQETMIRRISNIYHQLLAELQTYLKKAQVKDVEKVSYTLMCIIIGHDWAKTLGFGDHRNELMTQTLTALTKE